MTDITTLKVGGTVGAPTLGENESIRFWEVDIAAAVASATAAGNTFPTGSRIKLFDIPANSCIVLYQAATVTAPVLGTSNSLSIGDSSSATFYVPAASPTTAATMFSAAASAQKVYAAADAMWLVVNGSAPTSGVIRIVYKIIDCSRHAKAVYPTPRN